QRPALGAGWAGDTLHRGRRPDPARAGETRRRSRDSRNARSGLGHDGRAPGFLFDRPRRPDPGPPRRLAARGCDGDPSRMEVSAALKRLAPRTRDAAWGRLDLSAGDAAGRMVAARDAAVRVGDAVRAGDRGVDVGTNAVATPEPRVGRGRESE